MADRLSNEEFFTQLGSLLSACSSKGHGSVFLVQKHLTERSTILIRATDGNSKTIDRKPSQKTKFSTEVPTDGLEGFYTRYAEVCKAGMQALKKRDRSKRKKTKKAVKTKA